MESAPVQAFDPNVLTAVMAHMNSHHRDDCRLIARAFGELPEVDDALLTDLRRDGAVFTTVTPNGSMDVLVPWSRPMAQRSDHRDEMARMYRDACRTLALQPRGR